MATKFTDTPKIGVALLQKIDSADTKRRSGHRLGSQVWGSDDKRYVYAQAGGSISASTTACAPCVRHNSPPAAKNNARCCSVSCPAVAMAM